MMADIELVDAVARQHAIDPHRSCVVRAPAGSGKTELLIQRYLSLLANVERPDDILAITFTRKAATEMLQRVVAALQRAQKPLPLDAPNHEQTTRKLALAVLKRDGDYGWHLLHHTGQLQIKTIDSFNASLVKKMPWLTRMGGLPHVCERPEQLYQDAIEKILHLRHSSSELNDAIRCLLLHLDNRLDILQEMLMKLLAKRDQWLRHLLPEQGQARVELEKSLSQVVSGFLRRVYMTVDATMQQELLELGAFAAQHCARDDRPLCVLNQFAADNQTFPRDCVDDLELWRGLADLLLTAEGQWRKRCDKNCGFPAGKKEPFARMKQRMNDLLLSLREQNVSTDLWQLVRQLPPPYYSENQWQTLQSLLVVLPKVVAQLWLEFNASGQVDFVEISLRARQALVDSGDPTDQLLALDHKLQHILVDEFQDTSLLQFDLLQTLTSGWQHGDERSLFIVGDPMQSIYRFREAEVGLFLRAAEAGLSDIPLESLQLKANFRSQRGIVDWVNATFQDIFPRREDASSGAVSYSPAQATKPCLDNDAVQVSLAVDMDMQREACEVGNLVQHIVQTHPDHTIAILVRSRSHLAAILPHLRKAGIAYHAQDIDPLSQRAAVSDMVALTRALLHPADNLSWLTVLRAPWCGLKLADLAVFQCQSTVSVQQMLFEQNTLNQLSADGQLRVKAIKPILQLAAQRRGCCSLRQLVEETWLALRGSACYSVADCDDIEPLLLLLEQMDFGGDLLSFEQLEAALGSLFSAGTVHADVAVQVMTIHRAKGLEFDHVILPGLGKRARSEDKSLLRWQEHADYGLLLAPVTSRAQQARDPIYALLEQVDKSKGDYEVSRLVYVAVTRAKRHLYLFGQAELTRDGEPYPAKGSLLEKLWPALRQYVQDNLDNGDSGVSSVIEAEAPPFWRLTSQTMCCDEKLTPMALAVEGNASVSPELSQRVPAVIGTVTHAWLDYLATQCSGHITDSVIEPLHGRIAAQLHHAGISGDLIASYASQIVKMLQTTAASTRGKWILHPHPQACCEYAISGLDDRGEVYTLIVDRTFVIDDERWIIDYKTADLPRGQLHEHFYAHQDQQYRQQMEKYACVLSQLYPQHKCRCALYFPMFDGWYELQDLNGEHRLKQGDLFT